MLKQNNITSIKMKAISNKRKKFIKVQEKKKEQEKEQELNEKSLTSNL